MTVTYLQVSFRERDAVKALGARFDWDRKQWFVPVGQDLALFSPWLPDAHAAPNVDRELVVPSEAPAAIDLPTRGISLSRLLSSVAAAVAQAYAAGIWTTAEVLQVRGHWFLELAERLPGGEVVAKSNAVIWARNAPRLIAAFQQETGAALGAGIKVLLRAKPSFTPEHGFILVVDGIDASYTLDAGDHLAGGVELLVSDLVQHGAVPFVADPRHEFDTVWDAISGTPEESASMRARADLMIEIVKRRGWSRPRWQRVVASLSQGSATFCVAGSAVFRWTPWSTSEPPSANA